MANTPTDRKLANLLAYHENAAATLRATLALLAGSPSRPRASKNGTNGHALPAMFEEAIAIDATRRAKTPKKKVKSYADILATRRKSASLLTEFDRKVPRTLESVGTTYRSAGGLIRRGYLKEKGDGYVATGKVFNPDTRDAAKE